MQDLKMFLREWNAFNMCVKTQEHNKTVFVYKKNSTVQLKVYIFLKCKFKN